jgi:hypothetical protein
MVISLPEYVCWRIYSMASGCWGVGVSVGVAMALCVGVSVGVGDAVGTGVRVQAGIGEGIGVCIGISAGRTVDTRVAVAPWFAEVAEVGLLSPARTTFDSSGSSAAPAWQAARASSTNVRNSHWAGLCEDLTRRFIDQSVSSKDCSTA